MLLNTDLTSIHVYYYMPDHTSLIQLFAWQTLDKAPEFPRMHKFLHHWKANIEATIEKVFISHVRLTGNKFVNGKTLLRF